MNSLMIEAMERRWVPDAAIRIGIRSLCKDRLNSLRQDFSAKQALEKYAQQLRESSIAIHTQEANQQHYELPPEFFNLVLGKHRKYSSAFWSTDCKTLDDAEALSLKITQERAELKNGQRILELGCGWGSLTLSMAKSFPDSQIVALSNSAPQRNFIEAECVKLGIKNVQVLTRNVALVENLEAECGLFDRVVSVEMFEHLRNYEKMFNRVSQWLKPGGKCFIHVFTHNRFAYPFETEGEDNWMGKYFFTGGQMPAKDLFHHFQKDLKIQNQWQWDGTHYAKTAEAWLQNIDRNEGPVMKIFQTVYGKDAKRWFQRWRVFFMACAELFRYSNGNEWGVTHTLFQKEGATP